MSRKTIYVREADQELWEQAEKLAQNEESLASVVASALRQYVHRKQIETASTEYADKLRARQKDAVARMEAQFAEWRDRDRARQKSVSDQMDALARDWHAREKAANERMVAQLTELKRHFERRIDQLESKKRGAAK